MSDIKFRALLKRENKIFPCSGPWMGNVVLLLEHGVFKAVLELEVIVMQFTGLKDKNGKEIYEGDIVEYTGITVAGSQIMQVAITWNDQYASFEISGYEKNGIVIGNIYENPELLEND